MSPGTWGIGVFVGDTRENAERDGDELLAWIKREAGTVGNGYTVIHHDSEPPENITWTA